MELLLRVWEEPEPPEWLVGEWAGGSVSLQHSALPRASPSPSSYPPLPVIPISSQDSVLSWADHRDHITLTLKLSLRYPTPPYDIIFLSLDLGFDLFPFLNLCTSSLVLSCLLKVSPIWIPTLQGRTPQMTKDSFIR